jgi:prepilin-type N-terminal cleavage/methylation domain-containing protein
MTRGFTLIEVLVVMALIGVLAVLALQNYFGLRNEAFQKEALSVLRDYASAQEAYFVDRGSYLTCADAACLVLPGTADVTASFHVTMTDQTDHFEATATHIKSGISCTWNNLTGGPGPCT